MNEPLDPEVAVFNAALQLPAAQRAHFLDKACAGDARFRRQVEALLQAHARAGAFLEDPALSATEFGSARARDNASTSPETP